MQSLQLLYSVVAPGSLPLLKMLSDNEPRITLISCLGIEVFAAREGRRPLREGAPCEVHLSRRQVLNELSSNLSGKSSGSLDW